MAVVQQKLRQCTAMELKMKFKKAKDVTFAYYIFKQLYNTMKCSVIIIQLTTNIRDFSQKHFLTYHNKFA